MIASRGNKSDGLNVCLGDRKLVNRAWNTGYRNKFGAAHSIQMAVDVGHGSSLTDNVAVKGVTVVNTKTQRPICFTNYPNGTVPSTSTFLNNVFLQ